MKGKIILIRESQDRVRSKIIESQNHIKTQRDQLIQWNIQEKEKIILTKTNIIRVCQREKEKRLQWFPR